MQEVRHWGAGMNGPGVRPFAAGLGSSVSIAVGYIGFSFGVAAVQAGLPGGIAMLTSLVLYAGASQFLLISLMTAGAGVWTAVPTVLLMNARHVLYGPTVSAAIPKQHGTLGSPWLAFGLTDEVFATAMSRLPSVAPAQRDHWLLGLQAGAYVAWAGGTALGVFLVQEVQQWPEAVRAGLAFVLPALFLALLLETGLRRWWVCVVAAAGVAAMLSVLLPSHHALAVGMLAGAAAHGAASRSARR